MRVPQTAVCMTDSLELTVKLVGGEARRAGQDLPTAVGTPDICLPEPAKVHVEEGHDMGIGRWMVEGGLAGAVDRFLLAGGALYVESWALRECRYRKGGRA